MGECIGYLRPDPPACVGCQKIKLEFDKCTVRIYMFKIFNLKCPKEREVKDAIQPTQSSTS